MHGGTPAILACWCVGLGLVLLPPPSRRRRPRGEPRRSLPGWVRRAVVAGIGLLAAGVLVGAPWWAAVAVGVGAGAATRRFPARPSPVEAARRRDLLIAHADLLAGCLESGLPIVAALPAVHAALGRDDGTGPAAAQSRGRTAEPSDAWSARGSAGGSRFSASVRAAPSRGTGRVGAGLASPGWSGAGLFGAGSSDAGPSRAGAGSSGAGPSRAGRAGADASDAGSTSVFRPVSGRSGRVGWGRGAGRPLARDAPADPRNGGTRATGAGSGDQWSGGVGGPGARPRSGRRAGSPAAWDAWGSVAALLAVGADPTVAWQPAEACPDLAPVAAAARRSAVAGTPLAPAVREYAATLRAARAADLHRKASRAGVLMTAPLGLCFLPAFLCLGLAPVVLGLLRTLHLF